MFSFRTTPLSEQMDTKLLSGKVGCFVTQNCYDVHTGKWMWELFKERSILKHVFIPKEAELYPGTNHIEFEAADVAALDAVVVEIQDTGVRYFNYTKDVMRLMETLCLLGDDAPSLYIVDHINPAGRLVEGTIPSVESELYVPKVAHRHGLTLGELCNLYYNELGARFPLHIISATASDTVRQLLPWAIPPASDIPGLFTCSLYSGGGLWNNTSITPGIGTTRPYEFIGAPFIRPLDTSAMPQAAGAILRPASFTPSAGKYAGERCQGFQIIPVAGEPYHSFLHTLRLIRWFLEHYSEFTIDPAFHLKVADPVIAEYIAGNIGFDIVSEHVKSEEQKWIRKAKRYTLYEEQPYRIK